MYYLIEWSVWNKIVFFLHIFVAIIKMTHQLKQDKNSDMQMFMSFIYEF